jgi:hypothetical protein
LRRAISEARESGSGVLRLRSGLSSVAGVGEVASFLASEAARSRALAARYLMLWPSVLAAPGIRGTSRGGAVKNRIWSCSSRWNWARMSGGIDAFALSERW